MRDILAALPDVLGGTPLTRAELTTKLLEATGHHDLREPLNSGFGALLKPAAFRGLLCSGPRQGRSVTFVAPRRWLQLEDWDVEAEPACPTSLDLLRSARDACRADRRRSSDVGGKRAIG